MKRKCIEKIYKDDEYTKCSSCKDLCDRPIKCFRCGCVKPVFYNRKYDIFTCSKCEYELDIEMKGSRK